MSKRLRLLLFRFVGDGEMNDSTVTVETIQKATATEIIDLADEVLEEA